MKNYSIVASKKVIATFTMDYCTFHMKFRNSQDLVDYIVQEHPEFKDTPFDANFPNDTIVVEFYSIGNLIITEE